MAKPTLPTARTPSALTVEAAPTVNGILGVVLDINGTPVTINSGTIADMMANGIDFGITDPVDLDTVGNMIGYLNTTFGISIPTTGSGFPSPLDTIYNKVVDLDVTIIKAHLKIPGSSTPGAPTLYTLVMNVIEQGADIVSIGPIGLKGFVIGVTNETPTPSNP